jgi:hypothetical protein
MKCSLLNYLGSPPADITAITNTGTKLSFAEVPSMHVLEKSGTHAPEMFAWISTLLLAILFSVVVFST